MATDTHAAGLEAEEPKPHEMDEAEEAQVEDRSGLSSRLLYEIIRREGEEELARTNRSLFWAGVGAGILISFSVVGEAVLRTYLPDADWSYLIENIGYSFGFLLVILGRMQLFTENTITTVLPFMVRPCRSIAWAIARLWSLVLFANVVGAFAAAGFMVAGGLPADFLPAIEELSRHATGFGASEGFVRGVPAGILVAAIVWMIPQAGNSKFWVIVFFTWLIAAGDFTHIIAGSVEMAYLVLLGELGAWPAIGGFFLPVLAGNVVGGTVIFALMAWGQVKDDLSEENRQRVGTDC